MNARQRWALAHPLTGDVRADDPLIRLATRTDQTHLAWHTIMSIVAVDR